jgi:hypothetical protein
LDNLANSITVVRTGDKRRRQVEAEGLGGLQIDNQLEFIGLITEGRPVWRR